MLNHVLADTVRVHNCGIKHQQEIIDKKIEILQIRINNTQDMIANSDIPNPNYLDMLSRFNKERDELIMNHATLKAEASPKPKDVEYVIELFKSFDKLFNRCSYDAKMQMLGSIFPKPIIYSGRNFGTEEVSPLLELIVANSKDLKRLKIKTSHFFNGSSSKAPPVGLEPTTL